MKPIILIFQPRQQKQYRSIDWPLKRKQFRTETFNTQQFHFSLVCVYLLNHIYKYKNKQNIEHNRSNTLWRMILPFTNSSHTYLCTLYPELKFNFKLKTTMWNWIENTSTSDLYTFLLLKEKKNLFQTVFDVFLANFICVLF